MREKTKLKIGEFSKLCRVTVRALRHYEEKGLLKPAVVDEWTGYRQYDLSQSQRLYRILHLKGMGLSLDEIADILDRGDYRPDSAMIERRMAQCRAEIVRLQQQLKQLESLAQLSTTSKTMNKTTIKRIPSRIVASYRKVIKNYDELGPLCVNVIGPEMMRVGCTCPEPQYCYTMEHDAEHRDENIDLEYCEGVGEMHPDTEILRFYEAPEIPKALCLLHHGAYDRFSETMTEALAYIEEQGMQLSGNPRFCYLDGPWNKQDAADYLTEVQIPIK